MGIHLYSGFRSLVFKIVKFHNLGHDKSFLKIRVNLSRCLRRFRTPLKMLRDTIVNKEVRKSAKSLIVYLDRPRLDFVVACREEVLQLQRLVSLNDDLVEGARRRNDFVKS